MSFPYSLVKQFVSSTATLIASSVAIAAEQGGTGFTFSSKSPVPWEINMGYSNELEEKTVHLCRLKLLT